MQRAILSPRMDASKYVTDESKLEWVEMIKNEGTYKGDKAKHNCGLYCLAVYYTSVFLTDNKYTEWLSSTYKLNETDDWIAELDALAELNKQPLFDTKNIDRSKFVKIYKYAIDIKVLMAQDGTSRPEMLDDWSIDFFNKVWYSLGDTGWLQWVKYLILYENLSNTYEAIPSAYVTLGHRDFNLQALGTRNFAPLSRAISQAC